jgi:hypothetical protein
MRTYHMSGLIETWLLKTVDGRQVFMEPSGKATLERSGSNVAFEFRKGEHPSDNKEAWAKKISDVLGVDCVWLSKFYESKVIYGRPGNVSKVPDNP